MNDDAIQDLITRNQEICAQTEAILEKVEVARKNYQDFMSNLGIQPQAVRQYFFSDKIAEETRQIISEEIQSELQTMDMEERAIQEKVFGYIPAPKAKKPKTRSFI